MIGRFVATVTLLSLAGCAAAQQQQATAMVQEAQTQLQSIAQGCMQRMQADRDLDPIRGKIEIARSGMSGAPPPAMLADQSRPTSAEKAAIAKWEAMREACVQQEMQYGLSLSLPPNLEPLRDKLLLAGRKLNERTGLLAAGLYDGRLTYGQFAAERMKNTDQMVASLTGQQGASDNWRVTCGSTNCAGAPVQSSLASSATASLPGSEDRISLQRAGASYLVPVSVNGLPPMNFLLDTGSTDVALPAEVVFTLSRTGTLQPGDFIGNRTYVLADGRRLPSPTFRIRELRVGQHTIRDAIGSLSPALTQPLLGGSFLARFASWSIDNQRNVLILSP